MNDNDIDDDINLMQHLEESKTVATRGKSKINTTGRTHVARKAQVNSVGLLLHSGGFQVDAKWSKVITTKGIYIKIRGGLDSGEAVRMLRLAIALIDKKGLPVERGIHLVHMRDLLKTTVPNFD
jgi:hypothetical protein